MIQRNSRSQKQDIYESINQEEKRDRIRFYTRMTFSTSVVILTLVGYCLLYVAKGTAEYYICLFTAGINFFIICLVIVTLIRLKAQISHVGKK